MAVNSGKNETLYPPDVNQFDNTDDMSRSPFIILCQQIPVHSNTSNSLLRKNVDDVTMVTMTMIWNSDGATTTFHRNE